jgi:hypothetical protein
VPSDTAPRPMETFGIAAAELQTLPCHQRVAMDRRLGPAVDQFSLRLVFRRPWPLTTSADAPVGRDDDVDRSRLWHPDVASAGNGAAGSLGTRLAEDACGRTKRYSVVCS